MDDAFCLVLLAIGIVHVVTFVLRAMNVISVSWWIILIPELFMALGMVEICGMLLTVMVREAVRVYQEDRERKNQKNIHTR